MPASPIDHQTLLSALGKVSGVVAVSVLRHGDRQILRTMEEKAGNQAFMGLGRVVNSGVTLVLSCCQVLVGLTDMSFDWGCQPALILTKAGHLAGEEIRDQARLTAVKRNPNAWFMHPNFVIYKDRIDFPRDLMRNRCHFEIPALPAQWWTWPGDHEVERWSAMPATPCDLYLKQHYFELPQQEGLGTVLVGTRHYSGGIEREESAQIPPQE